MPFKLRGQLRPSCPHNSRSFTLTCHKRVSMANHLTAFALRRPTASSDTQAAPEHLTHKATGSFIPGLTKARSAVKPSLP